MKRKTYLLLMTTFLWVAVTSCEETDCCPPLPEIFYKSYVGAFIECDSLEIWSRGGVTIDEINKIYHMTEDYLMPSGITITVDAGLPKDTGWYPANVYHTTTEPGDKRPSAIETDPVILSYFRDRQEGFDKYTEQMGDTAYNRVITFWPRSTIVTIHPLEEVTITADKDFGNDYPAGASLNTFFYICFDDMYATIKNNYKSAPNTYRYKTQFYVDKYLTDYPFSFRCLKLTEANMKDYLFTEAKWDFFLHGKPEKTGTYTFHVKLKFANGTVLEGDAPAREIAGER